MYLKLHVTSTWMPNQTVIIDLVLSVLGNVMFLNVYLRWSQTLKAWMATAQNLLNFCNLYSLAILNTLWTQQLPHPFFPPHGSTRKWSIFRKVKPNSDPYPYFLSCQKILKIYWHRYKTLSIKTPCLVRSNLVSEKIGVVIVPLLM